MNPNNAGTGGQTTRLPPQIRDMSEKKKMTDRSVALLAKYHEDAVVNMGATTTQFRGWLGSSSHFSKEHGDLPWKKMGSPSHLAR